MTIAILSDTHIGDRSSRLTDSNGNFSPENPLYQDLKRRIKEFTGKKPLEFLVFAGDIMDFSINSISGSINSSRPFFQQISSDRLAKKIVYIPGNHDKQVWDGLQWDTSIIGNLSEHRPARPFARIQPAIISEFKNIELEGVHPRIKNRYGNIFLKGLFEDPDNNPDVILAYPNLYIRCKDETILVTHGHMFETAWILLSTLFRGVSGLPDDIGLRELEEWNIPLTSMIATGLGSGGKISELFYRIQREIYEKKTGLVSETLDSVIPRFKDELDLPWYWRMLLPDFLVKKVIVSVASKAEDPRNFKDYFGDSSREKHFRTFFKATEREMERLKLPPVKRIIFGHTHYPYSSGKPYRPKNFREFVFYNTGGWLKESKAEVFLTDKNRFESFSL